MSNSSEKLKILVLGGSGFIGSAVIPELLKRGHQVIATFCYHSPPPKDNNDLTWISWDGTKEPIPNIDWREVNAVLHLASYSDIWDFPSDARSIYQVMIESVFNILEKACTQNIRRVVVASTGDVLSSNIQVATEEDVNYMPRSFYGTAKACAELISNAYSSVLSTAILRLFHPYGPGGERFVINRLAMAVKEGNEITIEGKDGIIIS